MNRKLLIAATIATGLALLALLGYSIERTQWLFSLFETWSPAAWAAAIVVELAAVALLIGAGALSSLDPQARAWANRALVAVLSVQALANLTAGYLRGGRQALILFGPVEVPLPWLGIDARYAVAAALWFSVNLAVPGLILCLSKLAERLIAAAGSAVDAPLREQLASLRESLASKTQLLASTTADLAVARESADSLRERLASAEQGAASGATEAAKAREQATKLDTALASQAREVAHLREELAVAREQVITFGDRPPTQARVVGYVREQLASGRSLNDVARELGFSESTVRGWVKPATNGHLVAGEV